MRIYRYFLFPIVVISIAFSHCTTLKKIRVQKYFANDINKLYYSCVTWQFSKLSVNKWSHECHIKLKYVLGMLSLDKKLNTTERELTNLVINWNKPTPTVTVCMICHWETHWDTILRQIMIIYRIRHIDRERERVREKGEKIKDEMR